MNRRVKMKVIYIKGEKVCVTDEVHRVFAKSKRKERYLYNELKNETFIINQKKEKIIIIPHREDSYERLTNDCDQQFADESENTEDEAITNMLIDKLRDAVMRLSDTEKHIIFGLFFEDKTAKRISEELGVNEMAVSRMKYKILEKLRKILEN